MILPENFQVTITEDGSPSLYFHLLEGLNEPMHNLKGAFSETLYIYGENIQQTLKLALKPHFLSVGLGLGYNEFLILGLCLKSSILPQIRSFETESFLTTSLMQWLSNSSTEAPLTDSYEKILQLTANHLMMDPQQLKAFMLECLHQQHWQILGDVRGALKENLKFSSLLYDAFSEKMSPQLWTEEFLVAFLTRVSEDKAFFSTYAAKGTLNRALKKCGYQITQREGFKGKRQSTWASKGIKI